MREGRLHVGTSGWSYPHWRGTFYPRELPPRAWLAAYARQFRTVEINRSFYKMPSPEVLEAWAATVPADFVFAVKASRYITHMKKLKDPGPPLARFFEGISPLGDRLGPLLFQLPPRWRFDGLRFEAFLDALPSGPRYVFELRDPSWLNDVALAMLAKRGMGFCIFDLAGFQSPLAVTADFVYLRLHGPGGAYQGSYDEAALASWGARIRAWRREGLDVYAYFDNDQAGFAAQDALRLIDQLEGVSSSRPRSPHSRSPSSPE